MTVKNNTFAGSDIVTLKDIRRDEIEAIFEVAEEMEHIVRARDKVDLLSGKILGSLFYQVSTRTRLSFESAMFRLGGDVLGFADPTTSRAGDFYKESLHDTVKMLENYADVLVIRHTREGAPAEAAGIAEVPVINAGDGYNEHPTQALIDLFTIWKEKHSIDGLTLALVSDMNMRALHSLGVALGRYQTKVFLVSPSDLRMPKHWKEELDKSGLDYEEKTGLDDEVLSSTDVFYFHPVMTPSYHEGRADQKSASNGTPLQFVMNGDKLNKIKPEAIILHPLPRTDELPMEADELDAARYFKQAFYGVPVRMALLSLVLDRTL